MPTVGGTYTGSLSQAYHFSVVSGGTVGTDPLTLNWTSDSGQSGTLSVPAGSGGPISVADGLTLSLGSGTVNVGDKFSAATFVPQVSAAQDAVVQVGNQIVTSASNTVSNAISGVTLQLSGTGAQSTVTIAPDLTAEGNNLNAFVKAYNAAVNDIATNTQALPKQAEPALANDGGLRSTLFNLQFQMGTLNLSTLGITIDQTTGNLTFSQSSFEQSVAANPIQANQAIGALYGAVNPVIANVTTPIVGLIDIEKTSYQSQARDYTNQITVLNNQLSDLRAQLQAEYAQVQATVAGYQNIAQLFAPNTRQLYNVTGVQSVDLRLGLTFRDEDITL